MPELMLNDVIISTWQTIYMVFISSAVSLFLGLILGVILFLSAQQSHWYNKLINNTLGLLVNAARSIPYIILMILLIPVTTFLLGTSIGTDASIIPLILAAIPFYARIAETAIAEVDKGLIEAANSMGATKWQIIVKVLLPEARPQLISGATLTIISLIGFSAMAGAIGGGGLGTLAIQYGYQRFNLAVMLETVIILIIIVQLSQSFGDYLAKSKSMLKLWLLCIVLTAGSITQVIYTNMPTAANVIKVGVMSGPMTDIMKVAQKVATEKYNMNIKVISFDDYSIPNEALNSGAIDANIFQHIPFLESQIATRHYKITWIGKTFIFPMGLFSDSLKNIKNIKNGSTVAIPNDPTNEGRALLLLSKAGLIKLDPGIGWKATPRNIASNPYHLKFKELDAAQIPRILNQVALGAITNDYVGLAQPPLTLNDALYKEGKDSPFANIIVVRDADKTNPLLHRLVEVMHSQQVNAIAQKLYPDGAAIPAW